MSNTNTQTSFVGKHTFTQSEKDSKLQQMLAAMREKEEIEAELKTTKSSYKSKIDSKDAEIKLTSNLLNAGFENRTYQCNLVKNFEEGKRQYFELGSNILVGEEPLTASDYQFQMDLEEKTIRENNEAADQAIDLLHSGEEAPFELSAEEIEQAEAGPEYAVEPDSNPLEFEPNEEAKVVNIDKPTKQKGDKTDTVIITPTEEIEEVSDPFGMDESSEDDSDPFNFDI